MALPLERFRLLDLSRIYPGPLASHFLADMGMEVVKVEEPEPREGIGRDIMTPPLPTQEEEERYAATNTLARNKKSIILSLLDPAKRPQSQEVFYRLVQGADAILEGYRPGAVKWMGIDYETIKVINPGIVYCSISGFGQTGPYVGWSGHNSLFPAVAGSMSFDADGKPVPGSGVGDLAGSVYGAMTILAALLHREATGQGQYIDVALTSSSMALHSNSFDWFLRGQQSRGARQSPYGGGWASVTYLQCQDGKWLTTQNFEQSFWARFCQVIERPQYIALYRGAGPELQAMADDVRQVFRTRPRDEWLKLLASITCIAPVNTLEESLVDPQIRHLGMVWDLQHPKFGPLRQTGFPARFSETPVGPRGFAPLPGEHTRQLLLEAGYSQADIAVLEQAKVVKSWQQN